jgi:hypothetical protein
MSCASNLHDFVHKRAGRSIVATSRKRRSARPSRPRSARPTGNQASGYAITDALTTAARLSALQDDQRRLSTSGQAVPAESPALLASRRAAEDAGTALLVKAGFDREAFERARVERAAMLQRAAEEQHATAIAQSSAEGTASEVRWR